MWVVVVVVGSSIGHFDLQRVVLFLHRIAQAQQIGFGEEIAALGRAVPRHGRHDHGHTVGFEDERGAERFGHVRVHFDLRLAVNARDSVDAVECVTPMRFLRVVGFVVSISVTLDN